MVSTWSLVVPQGWVGCSFLDNFKNINYYISAAAAKSLQSRPTLCDPIDGSPPGSPVPGILQARTLEWVAISISNAWKWKVKVKSLQSCPTLSHPMDCSLPGSSTHGIFQARVLEWGASPSPYYISRTVEMKTNPWQWKKHYILKEGKECVCVCVWQGGGSRANHTGLGISLP